MDPHKAIWTNQAVPRWVLRWEAAVKYWVYRCRRFKKFNVNLICRHHFILPDQCCFRFAGSFLQLNSGGKGEMRLDLFTWLNWSVCWGFCEVSLMYQHTRDLETGNFERVLMIQGMKLKYKITLNTRTLLWTSFSYTKEVCGSVGLFVWKMEFTKQHC